MADSTEGLDPNFMGAIQAMIAASGGKLYIESGYRSVEEQTRLWNNAVAKYGSPEAARKWVAPPGRSNHNRGMAVDLGGDIELAHQLAPQFGLVFPMSWEPWHIEPVHARDGKAADPDAYTTPPPGQTNPVMDDALGSSPDFVAASLANAMRGALDPTMTGGVGMDAPTGQVGEAGTVAGASTGGAGSGATGGDASPAELYQALRAQGLDPVHAAAFVAVAGRESGYRTGAHNPDRSTGDNSYGLFQVNLIDGMHSQYSPEMLGTVQGSAQAAAEMYKASGTNPWGPYKQTSWLANTESYWQTAADASGGEVTADQIAGLQGEGLR